ncbi:MAG: ABC transporter permease [bacterium]|nr:ABC transporter permease [bacterium]
MFTWREIWLKIKKKGNVKWGGGLVLIFVLTAMFGPVFAPYDPLAIQLEERLTPPRIEHFLGTDELGRDVLSRLLYGARISLAVGLIATALATLIGLILGTWAGYFGGWSDRLIMRLVDCVLAFPGLLLAIGIMSVIGPSLITLFIVLALVGWAEFARLIRGLILSLKEQPYIQAAEAIGCSRIKVIMSHLLPNTLPLVIVAASLRIAGFILTEASLSFLGLGAQPPSPTWGSMVKSGAELYLLKAAPWMSLSPGVALAIVVIGFNLLGDGLRDILDPRLR